MPNLMLQKNPTVFEWIKAHLEDGFRDMRNRRERQWILRIATKPRVIWYNVGDLTNADLNTISILGDKELIKVERHIDDTLAFRFNCELTPKGHDLAVKYALELMDSARKEMLREVKMLDEQIKTYTVDIQPSDLPADSLHHTVVIREDRTGTPEDPLTTVTLTCDGKCEFSFGIEGAINRPTEYLMKDGTWQLLTWKESCEREFEISDPDNHRMLPDSMIKPQSREDMKRLGIPINDDAKLRTWWCKNFCERCARHEGNEPITVRDFTTEYFYNMPSQEAIEREKARNEGTSPAAGQ